jgi:hypothetical protein
MPPNRNKPDRNGRHPTQLQTRQRQLAWVVRITEGAEANLCAALASNGTKLTAEEFREVNRLRQELLILSRQLRHNLKGIK